MAITNNSINNAVVANNFSMPNTNAAGTNGVINFGGIPWINNYGTNNTNVGANSGPAIGSASSNNTQIGANAGTGNTGGANCTYIGYKAGFYADGSNNVAIGANSNAGNTGSSVVIGYSSGYAATSTNQYTVVVGANSFTSCSGGAANIVLGASALTGLEGGNYNISIGYQSGTQYTTFESSNILIGNVGVISENNVMRLGTNGSGNQQVNTTYIAGAITGAQSITASTSLTATSGNITATNGSVEVGNTVASTSSSNVDFLKSRTGGAITSGDVLGTVTFQGYDGTQYTTGSQIISTSSGTIASTRVASDLEFFTHPDSTTASKQRMVIASTGAVTINAPDAVTGLTVNINGSSTSDINVQLFNSAAATTAPKLQMFKNRSGGVITSGDTLGNIAFGAFDGTGYTQAAQIIGQSTGTIAAGQVGATLRFATHPASTSGLLTRLTIAETGAITIATPDSGIGLTIQGGGTNITGGITSITTFGTTTGVSGIPVVVDNTGLFGTIVSSLRYKENIQDIVSTNILNLKPVTFNYKSDESKSRRYGLIAEQVQEVMPDLVSYNIDGQVESVKYLDLPVLLLNEIQKLNARIKLLEEKLGV